MYSNDRRMDEVRFPARKTPNVQGGEQVRYSPRGRDVSWLSFMLSLVRFRALEKIPKGILLIWLCSMLIACARRTEIAPPRLPMPYDFTATTMPGTRLQPSCQASITARASKVVVK